MNCQCPCVALVREEILRGSEEIGMRKTRLWLLVLLLVLLACPALAETRYGVVYNSSSVNLREQPTQYSDWLGAYTSGKWVQISGESGNWYYVAGPDGKTGYMSKNYVKVEDVRYGTVGVVSNPKASSYLNLRAAPNYNAKVIDSFYNGVPCVLLNYANGWYHVRVDGVEGYFRQEYITRYTYAYSEDVATIVTPNNTGLNLRTGPGMDYTSIGQYKGGKYVMVLQTGDIWWKVSIDGKIGFMKAEFLKDGVIDPVVTGSSSSTATGTAYAVVSNPKATQVLNLRAKADATSSVLGQYRNGTKVTVLAHGLEWCKVKNAAGTVGYMMTKYLTLYNLPETPTRQVAHPQKTFVNLRGKPSMLTGTVLARVPHNAVVTVLSPASNGWVKVHYNGFTGYMVDYFLK